MRHIKKPYGEKPRVQLHPIGESRAKQSFAEECDINNILKKYAKTDVIDHLNKNPGRYEDLPMGVDYQQALNIAINAKQAFDDLPGTLRAHFDNDAGQFLEFMENPENDQAKVEMGLMDAPDAIPADQVAEPEPQPDPEEKKEPPAK